MWRSGPLRAQLDQYIEGCAPAILSSACCCQQDDKLELKVPGRPQRWYSDSNFKCEPELISNEDHLQSRSSICESTSHRPESSSNTSDRLSLRTVREGCGNSNVLCLEAAERNRKPTCDELRDLVNKNNECLGVATNMCLGVRGLDALRSRLTPRKIEATPTAGSRPTYHVALVAGRGSARKKLGFDIEMTEDRAVLTVLTIHGGLAGRWNQHNPDNMIHEGDCIIEVNGVWGSGAKMVEECKTANLIEMTLISLVSQSQASSRPSPRQSPARRVDRDAYYRGLP